MLDLSINYSRRVLVRLFFLLLISVTLVALGLRFIDEVYFANQLTVSGLAINGSIVGLFVLGTFKVLSVLWRYQLEEQALQQVTAALSDGAYQPESDIPAGRIIVQRLEMIRSLNKRNAKIDHSALAATLLASESTRLSFARFVNNTLILVGVFGTIVSLSVALVGASNLLGNVESMNGMERVIQGMSTALSTTMTAIVCYLVFGYFFIKLTDVQTRLLSLVEQVTTMQLLPQYSNGGDGLLTQVGGLLRSLQQVALKMQQSQGGLNEAAEGLREALVRVNEHSSPVSTQLAQIELLLREGFRLPETKEEK